MSHLPAIRFDLRIFLASSALALGVGCTQNVTPVGDGSGGEESTSQGTGGAGVGGANTGGVGATMVSSVSTGGAPGGTALALLDSELPDIGAGGFGTGVGGSTSDPNTLHVFLDDTSMATCHNPYDGPPCGNHWSVSFQLEPEQQQPGIYSMESVHGYMASTDDQPGECGWGGGSFAEGHVEVHTIDASGVSFTLVDTWKIDFDADGTYSASRCPAP